jgi:diguanylate cyclase (GGDEF)-like protein
MPAFSTSPLPPETVHEIIEALPLAVALLDGAGRVLEQNRLFARYGLTLEQQVARLPADGDQFELAAQAGLRLTLRRTPVGFCAIVKPLEQVAARKELLLSHMLQALHDTRNNLYQAAVRALAEATGWRWIGITRFAADGMIDVLAWWDTDHFNPGFSFAIAGTPCEVMVKKGRFCSFERVAELFPEDKPLLEMGADAYAGIVYQGKEGQPVGHIFMLDPREDADYAAAEEMLELMTILIGTELRLRQTEEIASQAIAKAHTDGLTGLGNRQAFDEDGLAACEAYAAGSTRDMLLAVIDLNGMKAVNDCRGHEAGDELLRLFARELRNASRAGDQLYRLGGDEFALLFPRAGTEASGLLRARLHQVVELVRLAGFPEMGASIGLASLKETDGELGAALRLADQRMYADKQSKTR